MNELRLIVPGRRELRLDPGGARELRLAIPARRELRLLRSGMQGPQGAPGPAGGVSAYEQTFAAAPSWTVNHNLARRPAAVRVMNDGGVEVEAEVVETSLNQLMVLFAAPESGRIVVL